MVKLIFTYCVKFRGDKKKLYGSCRALVTEQRNDFTLVYLDNPMIWDRIPHRGACTVYKSFTTEAGSPKHLFTVCYFWMLCEISPIHKGISVSPVLGRNPTLITATKCSNKQWPSHTQSTTFHNSTYSLSWANFQENYIQFIKTLQHYLHLIPM